MATRAQLERALETWPADRLLHLKRFSLWGSLGWGGLVAVAFVCWHAFEGDTSIGTILYIVATSLAFGLLWGLAMFAIMEVKYQLRSRSVR